MIVVVLGVPHSGTSIFARILHQLGVNMGMDVGNAGRSAKGRWNQRSANYEDLGLWEINIELIKTAGGTWYQPPDVIEVWRALSRLGLGPRITNAIRERCRHKVWGFKLPLVSYTAPVWHHYLSLWGSPRYLVTVRDQRAVRESMLCRFRDFPQHQDRDWLALYDLYYNRIAEFLELYRPPSLHVRHEELISHAEAESVVRSMAGFCGVPFSQKAMEGIEYALSDPQGY